MRTEISVTVAEDNSYLKVESNVRKQDMGIAWMRYSIKTWLKKSYPLIFQILKYELRTQIYSNTNHLLSVVEIQQILKQREFEISNIKLNSEHSRVSFIIHLILTKEQKKRQREEARWA